jgi:hypothetical protein
MVPAILKMLSLLHGSDRSWGETDKNKRNEHYTMATLASVKKEI